MPTSSITKDFVIKDPEDARRFIEALEESEEKAKNRKPLFSFGTTFTFTPAKDKEFYDKLLVLLEECAWWKYWDKNIEPDTEYFFDISIREIEKLTKE